MITQINQGTNLKSTRTLWGLSTYKLVCVPCLFLLKKKKKKKNFEILKGIVLNL